MPMRTFRENQSGNVVTLFALTLIPGLVFVGGALDYASAGRMHTALRDTLDASAVAAALAHARPDREEQARTFVRANAQTRLNGATIEAVRVTFDDATAKVTVSADAKVKATFMGLAGIDKINVTTSSTAVWAQSPNRISLVVDTTGSLRRSGVDGDLRAAATNFVDIISGGRASTPGLYVSLVPFASMVNVGPNKAGWLSSKYNSSDYLPGSWSGCVYERNYPEDISISPPKMGEFDPHLWPKNYTAGFGHNAWASQPASEFRNGVSGRFPDEGGLPPLGPNVGCMAPVIPLTTDMTAIKSRIGELVMLSASGGTVLTSGLAWGWRMLSPDWAPFWRTGDTIQPQDKLTGGTIVFISDGTNDWIDIDSVSPTFSGLQITGFGRPEERRFMGIGPTRSAIETAAAALGTTPADPLLAAKIAEDRADHKKRKVDKAIVDEQSKSERDAEKQWDDRFSQLCETIKASGVTLYTIAFGPNGNATNIMRKCATSKDHFFRSPSRTDLDHAFKKIAGGLTTSTTVRVIR